MTVGIYLGSPKHVSTDKVYIGQSSNIEERIRRHNSDLISGKHSPKMQQAYLEYGEFSWEIIDLCTVEELDSKEEYYIKLFDSVTNGFNTYESVNDAPILRGVKNPRVSALDKELYANMIHTSISNPHFTRLQVAEIHGVPEHVVSHLWYGTNRSWLSEIFPDTYPQLLRLRGTRNIGGKSAEQQGKTYPIILDMCFNEYNVSNIRQFAKEHSLDYSDLTNVLNKKSASVKGWILKDLDQLDPSIHSKFMSTNRGHYKKQFNLYKGV